MKAADLPLSDRIRLLSGSDFWHTAALPDADVPALLLSDGPHGLRTQADGGDHLGLSASTPATCFPPAVTLASSWDLDLVERIGAAVAAEARALGVAVVLGPGLNIKRHPRCGRNFEYFSEDPLLSGRLAAAMVRGIQAGGVAACLKHFAVNNQESHRFVVDAIVDERTLRELYLSAFEHVVATEQPQTVMAAYNLVNGEHCTDSRRLLTDILREEWGFTGLVMSDWAATNDRVAAVRAGMDLEMPGSRGGSDAALRHALQGGDLAEADVTTAAQRVLDLMAATPRTVGPTPDFDAADGLATEAAAAGMVLLANNGLLPLPQSTGLAVIGAFARHPRYQGSGSSQVNPVRVTSVLDALAERGGDVAYAAGYDPDYPGVDPAALEQSVAAASRADAVLLMVGLPGVAESEGFDRADLRLPAQHVALIEAVCAANPRTVVALSNGAPVDVSWADRPAALLETYLGGQASGRALVDVIFGDREPGGRLAESFPEQEADLAAAGNFPGVPHQVQYREGLAVGYRHLTTAGIAARFPFGHGLGYTAFEVGDVAADRTDLRPGDPLTVTITVRNVGTRAGSTVVQVYRHDCTGAVPRPRRELVGFAKITLAAGRTTTAAIELGDRSFAWYDPELADWRIPDGRHELEVGFSSEDIVATLGVQRLGGDVHPRGGGGPLVAASDADFAARLGHPIPPVRALTPYSRLSTVAELSGTAIGRVLRAAVVRVGDPAGADTPATRQMIERSIEELPLRALVPLSGGRVRYPMIDAIIDLANRRPDRTIRRTLGGGVGRLARTGRLSRLRIRLSR